MTPAQLRKLIDLKYGKGGQTRFAAAICVHVTTVQKWLAGKHRINPLVKGHFDV